MKYFVFFIFTSQYLMSATFLNFIEDGIVPITGAPVFDFFFSIYAFFHLAGWAFGFVIQALKRLFR